MTARPNGSGVKGKHANPVQPWGKRDLDDLIALRRQGWSVAHCARQLGRSFGSVENTLVRLVRAGKLPRGVKSGTPVESAPPPVLPHVPVSEQRQARQLKVTDSGASAELTTTTHEPIRTLEDLITVCEIDVAVWEVVEWTANSWESSAKDAAKQLQAKTLYQVKARLKKRTGPTTAESIEAMVRGAVAARTPPKRIHAIRTKRDAVAQVLIIADPHFGKLCWSKGTGGADYDVDIARRVLLEGAAHLMANAPRVAKRYIVSLGDYFHFDTLAGTTTKGTFVDRDSRVPKMLDVGTDTLARIVRQSAALADTELVIVPGNHDEVLSASLQRVMVAEFRRDSVIVDDTHTRSKVRVYGRNFLGFNHGDKNKKALCGALQFDYRAEWGLTTYAEIHTGHLHSEQEHYQGTMTHAGVTLRTHRTLSPPDQFHADELFVGAPRGMSAWLYDVRGGLAGMHMYSPDMERAA